MTRTAWRGGGGVQLGLTACISHAGLKTFSRKSRAPRFQVAVTEAKEYHDNARLPAEFEHQDADEMVATSEAGDVEASSTLDLDTDEDEAKVRGHVG